MSGVVFTAQPNEIIFHDFIEGQVYEREIRILNVSSRKDYFRIRQPKGKQFKILPLYSEDEKYMAPGMFRKIKLIFSPDSLKNFNDEALILSEFSSTPLPIIVQRRVPQLSLPLQLELGPSFVDSEHSTTFDCKNNGGEARFRFCLENDCLYAISMSLQFWS